MKLVPYAPRHDAAYFQDFFVSRYGLEAFESDYFRYVDYEYIVESSEAEHAEFMRAVTAVNRVFVHAYPLYRDRLAEMVPEFAPLFADFRAEYPIDEHFIGRYDVIVDADTGEYQFLETNANTPGLVTESHHLARMLTPEGYRNQSSALIRRAKDFFAAYKGKTIGILLPYSFEDEDYLTGMDYRDMLLEDHDASNVVLGDIFECNAAEGDGVYIKGKRVDVVLSFFPLEFFLTDTDFMERFFDHVRSGRVRLHNPLESIALQDKGLYALIYENIDAFDEDDQRTIRKHLPFTTREFREAPEYLAKWRFGRFGREIHMDHFYTNIDDQKDFVFQKRIRPQPADESGNFLVYGAYSDYQ